MEEKMKRIIIIILIGLGMLALAAIVFPQTTIVFPQIAINATGTGRQVTVVPLTEKEQADLDDASAAIVIAQKVKQDLEDKIVIEHGGYIQMCGYDFGARLCGGVGGQRMSDEVEWKLPYLIITKRYWPQN
jgi:hypothetical protein